MPRVLTCRAEEGHWLWLRFHDGLEGRVFLGNLVDIGAFRAWRDVRQFMSARVDAETGNVVWPAAGVHLDPEILWHDIAARQEDRAPSSPLRLFGSIERLRRPAAPPRRDPAFDRFMARVLQKPRRRK